MSESLKLMYALVAVMWLLTILVWIVPPDQKIAVAIPYAIVCVLFILQTVKVVTGGRQ